MPRPDGTIRIDSKIDTKGFNTGVKGLEKGLNPVLGLLTKIGAAVGAAFAVGKVVSFTASVTKLSAEFERLQISALAVGQLHGIAAEETRKLTDELTHSGVQTDIANRAFINFAQNGLDQNLLPALARGAQDLAVFAGTGETSSDILDRLSDGILTLNSLMLRNANVAIDVNEEEKKFAKNLGLTTEQLTIQQKRQAVTLAVLEKLKDVQGLYTLSQKTAAGQLSSNVRIMNEFRAAIGTAFQGAFYKLIKGWNDLVKVMTASLKEGGKLHDLFVRIGTVAAFLADVLVRLFRAIALLFGVELSTAVDTASGQLDENVVSAKGAADAQNDLADATEAAGKAAKGALASFDDLNVLQQDTGGVGDETPEDVGIPDTAAADFSGLLEEIEAKQKEIQDRVDTLKAKLFELFQPLIDVYNEHVKPILEELGGKAWEGLKWVWDNILIPFGKWLSEEFGPVFLEFIGTVLETWNLTWETLQPILEDMWNNVLKPFFAWLGDVAIKVFEWLIVKIGELNEWIKTHKQEWGILVTVLAVIAAVIAGVLAGGISLVLGLLIGLIFIIANAGKAWQMFIDLLKLGLLTAFNVGKFIGTKLRDALISAFQTVKDFVKGVINDIIGFINGMVSRVTSGINTIINAANKVGGILPGYAPIGMVSTPQIPYLATGAVIPPNARFAAVLGDQTAGRNLEAPEGLIRSIIREEIGNIDANIQIEFKGSLAQLVRELKPHIDRENIRLGRSMIKGGASL